MSNIDTFDNLPMMRKEEAFILLNTPPCKLKRFNDYYNAIHHLMKYPGEETENKIIEFLELDSTEWKILIAKRKAIEALTRLKCKRAINLIALFLKSDDKFLVESSAWSLSELGCMDIGIQQNLIDLLDDAKQNRRVIIQSLSSMGVTSHLRLLHEFADKKNESNLLRGAALASLYKISPEKNLIKGLKSHLQLKNQNSRHCAVLDIINAGASELIFDVLNTPVAPFFRLKAFDELWPISKTKDDDINMIKIADQIIIDDPNKLDLISFDKEDYSDNNLFEMLFSPEFSRAYFALVKILSLNSEEIFLFLETNIERIKRDYGAIYFFILLLRFIDSENSLRFKYLKELSIFAISDKWPAYMKFRPLAILSLMKFYPYYCENKITEWLNELSNPFWACRYAVLINLDYFISNKCKFRQEIINKTTRLLKDKNRFIRAKSCQVLFENK